MKDKIIRIKPKTHKQLKHIAVELEKTLSETIEYLISTQNKTKTDKKTD